MHVLTRSGQCIDNISTAAVQTIPAGQCLHLLLLLLLLYSRLDLCIWLQPLTLYLDAVLSCKAQLEFDSA